MLVISVVAVLLALAGALLWVAKPFRGTTTFHGTEVVVSDYQFGTDWPFTVTSGELLCEDSGEVSFEVGSSHITRYALNAAARAEEARQRRDPMRRRLNEEHGRHVGPFWKDVELIRAVNPDGSPASFAPIVKRGLTYCEPDFEP